jgi:protein-tyrosine-phosphatase
MPSILFVCSANQCRSPMAEVLFEALLEQHGERDKWRVESAGVWAYNGARATTNAQKAMQERGLDLSRHVSQPAERTLLKQFNLIVVMEVEHKSVLQQSHPDLAERIFTIRELVGQQGDFNDPVGGSLEVYTSAAEELEELLIKAYEKISKLS